MKNIFYFFLGACTFLFVACDQDSEQVDASTKSQSNNTSESVVQNLLNEKGRTKAGYEYVHHIKNDGPKPEVGDQIRYHKVVKQSDTIFLQSTYLLLEPREDILISRDSVPQPPHPIYDALFLMSPGDSLTVYQDLDTFPKDLLPPKITNDDYFTYSLKMLSIKPKSVIDKEIADIKARDKSVSDSLRTFIKNYKAGKLKDQLTTTENNLTYFINKEGKGKKVKDGGFVKVYYIGMLEDGTVFDGNFKKAELYPARIGRGRVIPGWDQGIPLLNEGSEATFVIPYELAYGVAGSPPTIPERADLYFFISLVKTY